MKLTLVLSAVFAIYSYGQEGERRGRGPGGPGGMRMSPSMRVLDTDQDGVISAPEMQQAASKLAVMDRNSDGRITEDEVRPQGGPPRSEGRGEGRGGESSGMSPEDTVNTLMQFDKNKDGKLTKEEVPERMQGVFARNDGNKDGTLTREELLQGATKQSQASERGEGGRGGGMMKMDPVFAALDADQNGEIAQAEWKNAPSALAKLDQNHDGQLTADEVRLNFPGGGSGGGRRGGDHE